MKMTEVTGIKEPRGAGVGVLGGILALAGVAGFVASVLDLIGLREANLLLASGGAMALGLIFVAASLFLRLREAHEARLLDAEFFLARRELKDALALSEKVRRRFEPTGVKPRSVEG
ncbi:MAG: hypothetical protein HY322_02475 [Betaproteobacteria bacterium]|nr:hypothetical protein [Betaproteobacteria bacterium]